MKSTLIVLAIVISLPILPAAAADTTPSAWLGVSRAVDDGIQDPSAEAMLQLEHEIGAWEVDARAEYCLCEKVETGDGYLVHGQATVQRWIGKVGPGAGLLWGRQETSRWHKEATWAVVVLGLRPAWWLEVTVEWLDAVSGVEDAGDSIGAIAEVPLGGPWSLRGSVRNGGSVGLAVGWKR